MSDSTTGDDLSAIPGAVPNRDKGIKGVRASDIEPYTGLNYLSTLFKALAVIMLLLLVAEVATGFFTQGSAAIPTLLGEASRLIVMAGVLWGTGDLAHLLIDVGHDVRAARIMAARATHAGKGLMPRPREEQGTRFDSKTESELSAFDRERPVTPPRTFGDRPANSSDSSDSGDKGPPIP